MIEITLNQHWPIKPNSITLARDLMNKVYYVTFENGEKAVARFTHQSHRTKQLLESELGWLQQLHNNNINCCYAIPTQNNELLIETQLDNENYYVCCFNLLPGKPLQPSNPEFLTAKVIKQWGSLVGQIHQQSISQNVSKHFPRHQWYQEHYLEHTYLERLPEEIQKSANKVIEELRSKPTPSSQYGMIHNDIKADNFLYHNGEFAVFDFDMSCNCWYINDIVNAIYYSYGFDNETFKVWMPADEFIKAFMLGYNAYNKLDNSEKELLEPLFLFREILCLIVMFDIKPATPEIKQRLDGYKEQIIERINNFQLPIERSALQYV